MKLNLILTTIVMICATSLFGQDDGIKVDVLQLSEREEQLATLREQFKEEVQNEIQGLHSNLEAHVGKVAKQKGDLAIVEELQSQVRQFKENRVIPKDRELLDMYRAFVQVLELKSSQTTKRHDDAIKTATQELSIDEAKRIRDEKSKFESMIKSEFLDNVTSPSKPKQNTAAKFEAIDLSSIPGLTQNKKYTNDQMQFIYEHYSWKIPSQGSGIRLVHASHGEILTANAIGTGSWCHAHIDTEGYFYLSAGGAKSANSKVEFILKRYK
jgi:hypothetical protein